ncbi:MAG: tyrosine-type recombinase/integrase [Candidatus Poribacteria bacterium]|nr:tyrosine-type recombinase/integrase [Candidatus Poribacteria bacterium]
MKLNAAVNKFESYLETQDRSPATIQGYKFDLKMFVEFILEDYDGEMPSVETLDFSDVGNFKRHAIDAGKKPSTINRYIIAVRKLYKYLVKEGIVSENIADDVTRLKEDAASPKCIAKEDIRKIERAIKKSAKIRNMAMFSVLKNSGIRVSELCNLKWTDYKPTKASGEATALLHIRHGKGSKSRLAYLNSEGVGFLRKYRKIQDAKRNRNPIQDSEYIFASTHSRCLDKPVTEVSIRKMLKSYCERCGIETIKPHDLRHTFAKNLIDAGKSVTVVAKLLGHSNLNMVFRYTTPTEVDLSAAVEEIAWT